MSSSIINSFAINAKSCTLKINSNETENILLDEKTKYLIPIYQRPYSWTEKQVVKIIQDMMDSYENPEGSEEMFIGTMQLSMADHNHTYQVIDGQQRLSTFLVLIKLLQLKYPENNELSQSKLNWLQTKVNLDEQQKYLQEFLKVEKTNSLFESSLNPYIRNAHFINEILVGRIEHVENNQPKFNIDKFIRFVFSKVYFVIIETRAGLSKTLQIFDAINTTGLDLNGGDIFKIRMYEYLSKEGYIAEDAFAKINEIYALLDTKNKHYKTNITFAHILHIYQYILISEFDLPNQLYKLGSTTFFERLFDTIFEINDWINFEKAKKGLKLSLDTLIEIIKVRFQWKELDFKTPENRCAIDLIGWSRYSRYWILILIFMYKFKNEPNFEEELLRFIRQLTKLYLIYSIRYKRAINEIHRFSYRVINKILYSTMPETILFINIGIKKMNNAKIDNYIQKNLTNNAKRKNILCRLSALLEENYNDSESIKEIREKLFSKDSKIDIEHIQSLLDEDKKERKNIIEKWGEEINSIGNLMVLESKKNRSIGNSDYGKKKPIYETSVFQIVNKQASKYQEGWTKISATERKEKELRKIKEYLFS